MSKQATIENIKLQLTRVFDAPRDLVFNAWTDANKFKHWFGAAACEGSSLQSASVPKESFITFLINSHQGRVRYALGFLYFAGWIFIFAVGFGVGRHESASTTYSCPVLVNGEMFYYRPWIDWFLKHGPLTFVGLIPLAFLAEWFRWRKIPVEFN